MLPSTVELSAPSRQAALRQGGGDSAPFAWLRESPPERILILRLSALGDVVQVLPSVAALKELFPRAEIHWLVEPMGAALLEGHPQLADLIVLDRGRLRRSLASPLGWPRAAGQILELRRELRRRRFDLAIDFQANLRSGLLARLSGARWRLGFHPDDCREGGGRAVSNLVAPPAPPLEPKALKNLHLLRCLGWQGEAPPAVLPIADEDARWAELSLRDLPGSGPLVALHPAVSRFGLFKQWPLGHWRELCRMLERQLEARLLVTWGPGEEELARQIAQGLDRRVTVAPPTPRLKQLAALVAASDLLVAGDTGCLHLAAALGTPVVGLYGPKSAQLYGPWPRRGRVLQSEVPCSPCRLRRCEHRVCMSEIRPSTVAAAAAATLASGRAGEGA